jgi:Ni/Co efflux regulator RcnB
MKITLLSATALALILSVPAFAAPHDHSGDHGDHASAPPAHTDPTPPPGGGALHGAPHDAHSDHPGHGDVGRSHGGRTPPGNTNNTPNAAAILNGGGMMGTHHDRGGHGNNTAGPVNPDANSRTHAGRGHNSAFDALRRAFNAPHHYRYRGAYNRPNGYYAHRWTFGEFLPALFFGSSYWINDYGYYDLAEPPAGTVWVRYGDDALLIDRYSGEVIQVEYGIFY